MKSPLLIVVFHYQRRKGTVQDTKSYFTLDIDFQKINAYPKNTPNSLTLEMIAGDIQEIANFTSKSASIKWIARNNFTPEEVELTKQAKTKFNYLRGMPNEWHRILKL